MLRAAKWNRKSVMTRTRKAAKWRQSLDGLRTWGGIEARSGRDLWGIIRRTSWTATRTGHCGAWHGTGQQRTNNRWSKNTSGIRNRRRNSNRIGPRSSGSTMRSSGMRSSAMDQCREAVTRLTSSLEARAAGSMCSRNRRRWIVSKKPWGVALWWSSRREPRSVWEAGQWRVCVSKSCVVATCMESAQRRRAVRAGTRAVGELRHHDRDTQVWVGSLLKKERSEEVRHVLDDRVRMLVHSDGGFERGLAREAGWDDDWILALAGEVANMDQVLSQSLFFSGAEVAVLFCAEWLLVIESDVSAVCATLKTTKGAAHFFESVAPGAALHVNLFWFSRITACGSH